MNSCCFDSTASFLVVTSFFTSCNCKQCKCWMLKFTESSTITNAFFVSLTVEALLQITSVQTQHFIVWLSLSMSQNSQLPCQTHLHNLAMHSSPKALWVMSLTFCCRPGKFRFTGWVNAVTESPACFFFQFGIPVSHAFSTIAINAHKTFTFTYSTWLKTMKLKLKGNCQWTSIRHFSHCFITHFTLSLCMCSPFVPQCFQKCATLFIFGRLSWLKSQWLSSSVRQTFKGYFYSLLCILKHNFYTQSERLEGKFEVLLLVHEYAQTGFFREPCTV